jgi:hypothetical protein
VKIRTLPGTTPAHRAEEAAQGLTDGSFPVVLYEVFDHPLAVRRPGSEIEVLGAWVMGRPDDVVAYLEKHGREDFREHGQYGGGADA